MQRNTRTNRNVAKPFVSGGVISNFTGNTPIVPAPVAAKPTVSALFVSVHRTKPTELMEKKDVVSYGSIT